jgi:hypothetical protein
MESETARAIVMPERRQGIQSLIVSGLSIGVNQGGRQRSPIYVVEINEELPRKKPSLQIKFCESSEQKSCVRL